VRVASMFAGIGGICIGFRLAGASLVWANDIDRYACATYRHNFGNEFHLAKPLILSISILTQSSRNHLPRFAKIFSKLRNIGTISFIFTTKN